MFEIRVNPDTTVEIPQVGIYCEKDGKSYEILKVTTYQEIEPGSYFKTQFTTHVELLRVNDEGDDLGEPTITVKWDESCKEL